VIIGDGRRPSSAELELTGDFELPLRCTEAAEIAVEVLAGASTPA
jgi:hypothetical protein